MSIIGNPDPSNEPTPEEMASALAHLEELANQGSASTPSPRPQATGETRRVRKLRAEVAEAHLLADLQEDDAPLLLDTPKVRKRRKSAQQAARLHTLAQDPEMRAWQAARMRRLLVTAALISLTLALAWSTAGVQHFAADGAAPWSPAWVFAWLVEPFLSLALLVVVGARAYLGTRGQPLDDPKLVRIEWLFLGLTLSMNAWPYLPFVADDFSLSRLVLHVLGPIVAVAVVTALPIILAAFSGLDHSSSGTPTTPSYRVNAATVDKLTARARRLVGTGQLSVDAGADKFRRALGCGMDTARAVRDALRSNPNFT
ncbi:hypothetical protein ACIBK9_04915 [Nonomuraea sp. NPDC050227]|uniref:hypothetical protein n=1 Tax=Nonomuraea sp. NPDC050227 TaxID=3364360 RepID=UPI003793C654